VKTTQSSPNRPEFPEQVKKLLCCYVVAIGEDISVLFIGLAVGLCIAEKTWAKLPINGGSGGQRACVPEVLDEENPIEREVC
jgi:hypothetical protein